MKIFNYYFESDGTVDTFKKTTSMIHKLLENMIK